MKILVRQISTGLYWKTGSGWVQADDAEVFSDSSSALLYCIKGEMRDVHVILSFDDPQYDIVLHPFGERGNELTAAELIEASHRLKEKSQGLKEASKEKTKEMRALLGWAQQTAAAVKEARKKLPFRRKGAGGDEG